MGRPRSLHSNRPCFHLQSCEGNVEPTSAIVLGGVALGVVAALVYTVRSLIVICLPNEMVVVTGRKRTTTDGRLVGYRGLHGGRTLRIPIVEEGAGVERHPIP